MWVTVDAISHAVNVHWRSEDIIDIPYVYLKYWKQPKQRTKQGFNHSVSYH